MQQDIAARYLALRQISKRLNNEIMDLVARPTIEEWARRIGLGRYAYGASEEEGALVMDLCVHAAKPGRSRAIDRFAQSARAPSDRKPRGCSRPCGRRNSRFGASKARIPMPASSCGIS
jgi:hypothetical protein